MSKAILKFDLSNEDDEMALKRAIKSTDMAKVISEIQHNVRKQMTTSKTPEEYVDGVEDTLNFINELIEEHGINIDSLIH